jgi:hypothetical protein
MLCGCTYHIIYNINLFQVNCALYKIHLKDIDDGALHLCILFLWTLSTVPVS